MRVACHRRVANVKNVFEKWCSNSEVLAYRVFGHRSNCKGCALAHRFSTWESPRSSQWVWTYTVCRLTKQYISHIQYCISCIYITYMFYCDECVVKSFVTTVNEFVEQFLIVMHVFNLKSPDNANVRMWDSANFQWNQKGAIYWTRVVTTSALYTSRLSVTKWH